MKGASGVSVIVVSYNTREKLRRCLACIEAEHDVIVVDNASSDGSVAMVREEFPHVRLLENEFNVGFGQANNQGLDLIERPLALFLNSDCYASPGAISGLAAVFADEKLVGAGGKLLNPDGSLQESAANELTLWVVFCEQFYLEKLFKNSRFLSPYWMSRRLLPAGGEVAQVMGACLMIRPLERFDDRYFLYCEDTDLCHRLRSHGAILYAPRAEFTHELGSSSSDDRWRAVARYNRGKELFFAINYGKTHATVCFVLNRLGSLLRFLVWSVASILTLLLLERFRRQAALFWRVLWSPVKGPA